MIIQCGIYKITNIINSKIIIGQSKNTCKRWVDHKYLLRRNKHYNHHLQAAWNKYGEQNFKFEIILLCLIENLNAEEIRLIKEYNSTDRNIGYNVLRGGNRSEHTEETKRKIGEANRGEKNYNYGKHRSEETKRKIGAGNKGKIVSKESRQRMIKSHLGKKNSKEAIQKMIKANTGKTRSEESKRRIGDAHRGEKHYNYGKHLSEDVKRKLSNSLKGRIMSEETKQKMRKAYLIKAEGIRQKVKESWIKRENEYFATIMYYFLYFLQSRSIMSKSFEETLNLSLTPNSLNHISTCSADLGHPNSAAFSQK